MSKRLRIAIASILLLTAAMCGAGYATTTLVDTATWCAGVKTPDPGDPVRATGGVVGSIRDGLICLGNRTASIVKGTVSLNAVWIDGTGALGVSPVAGTLTTSGDATIGGKAQIVSTVSGTSMPTPATALGQIGRGLVPLAWAKVNTTACTLSRGIGIASCTRNGTGWITLALNLTAGDVSNIIAVATADNSGSGQVRVVQAIAGSGGAILEMYDLTGTARDGLIYVVVYGE